VVCLDEKPVTLHADVRPASRAQPGREARRDSEYERRGTANVFCAVEPKAGRHFTFPTPNRSAFEFARVACHLAMQYPEADTIHLVMDNLNIHSRKSLRMSSGQRSAMRSGTASPFISPPPTEAGSIRRKSKSASTRGNASVPEDPRPPNATPGKPGLEPPNEPRQDQDRLEIRPPGRASQIRL